MSNRRAAPRLARILIKGLAVKLIPCRTLENHDATLSDEFALEIGGEIVIPNRWNDDLDPATGAAERFEDLGDHEP